MNVREYTNFCNCRRVSFSLNPQKFRQWLLQDFVDTESNSLSESRGLLKLDNFALETLQFLAYECVSEVGISIFLSFHPSQQDNFSQSAFSFPSCVAGLDSFTVG